MNKRMLEIYRQAQIPSRALDPSNNMPYETTEFSAEKFAELIVRECALQCQHNDDMDRIEKHFGIKE